MACYEPFDYLEAPDRIESGQRVRSGQWALKSFIFIYPSLPTLYSYLVNL